jgi:hypothetical protein
MSGRYGEKAYPLQGRAEPAFGSEPPGVVARPRSGVSWGKQAQQHKTPATAVNSGGRASLQKAHFSTGPL